MRKKPDSTRLIEAINPRHPDRKYALVEVDRPTQRKLTKPPTFQRGCPKACTAVMTLLPKMTIPGHEGRGYFMMNIDGYRTINAYVISTALSSTAQRGFSLELSFALNPFVPGIGVVGETSVFFNCDHYYDPTAASHRTLICDTSDLTSLGGVPWIGGVDLTHILRVSVMGPYVRASAFNEDSTPREVEVRAYLST